MLTPIITCVKKVLFKDMSHTLQFWVVSLPQLNYKLKYDVICGRVLAIKTPFAIDGAGVDLLGKFTHLG